VIDDRVDEIGEAAIRGQVVDLFPASSRSPHRIDHADGRVEAIRIYDPLTQRTVEEVQELLLTPVSELWLSEPAEARPSSRPGLSTGCPTITTGSTPCSTTCPRRRSCWGPGSRRADARSPDQINDSHEGRSTLKPERDALPRKPLAPERLYLDEAEWSGRLAERAVTAIVEAEESAAAEAGVPRFVAARNPERAFAAFVGEELKAGRRVAIAAALPRDLLSMTRLLARRLGRTAENAANWDAIRAAAPGTLLRATADLEGGFRDSDITVVAASDLLGSRAGSSAATESAAKSA
jgi:transcription-repair coupling factor (superfamily II helicase)